MVQIIEENRRPSTFDAFSQMSGNLANAGANYLKGKSEKERMQKEDSQLSNLLGQDVSGLNPELKKMYLQYALQGQLQEGKLKAKADELSGKKQEEMQSFKSALNILDKMKGIRKKGNLGRGSSVFSYFGGESAKDRGEYETLGNSLIQYASNIPIRNKSEFEKLAGKIGDPNITDDEAEGVLEAMKQIISSSLQQYDQQEQVGIIQPKANKRPLTSFER